MKWRYWRNHSITLILDAFYIEPGSQIIESRKNCQLSLNITYPTDYHYSISSTTYREYTALSNDDSETQHLTYYFANGKMAFLKYIEITNMRDR